MMVPITPAATPIVLQEGELMEKRDEPPLVASRRQRSAKAALLSSLIALHQLEKH